MIFLQSNRFRSLLLLLAGLGFLAIAIGSTFAPDVMASQLGYLLNNVDARNEFRAVYVGVWTATSILFFTATWYNQIALIGDLGAILILGQVGGRLLSLLLDGIPSEKILPVFTVELISSLAILLIRPKTEEKISSKM